MTGDLWGRFKRQAAEAPDAIAIQHKERVAWKDIRYNALEARMGSLAAFLAARGVKKGDRIAVLMENRPAWPVVFFAAVSLGASVVPISPESVPLEVKNILNDSGSETVFVSEKSLSLMDGIQEETPAVKNLISVDSEEFSSAVTMKPDPAPREAIDRDDTACILYTSGTTGEPKGVVLSHGNLISNCDSARQLKLITSADRIVSILPLHHAYPLMATMILPFLCGGGIVYPETLRGETLLEAMRDSHATILAAVPRVFSSFREKIMGPLQKAPFAAGSLNKFAGSVLHGIREKTGINPGRYLFRRIHAKFGAAMRLFITGGAKLDAETGKFLSGLGFTILEGYGLTETSPILTFNPLKKPKMGSAGLPVPGVTLKIENENEKGVGEVIAAGPNIMQVYYKRPDLTAAVIKNGWFHTGDLGYVDKDGYLFLTGRIKDVIVLSSGMNVFPEEVEKAYAARAPIKEMCVFAASAREGAERSSTLRAVVVPDLEVFKKYGAVNLRAVIREIFNDVSRTLPAHMRLGGFSLTLEALPRTLLGKIKRFAVKEDHARREDGTEAADEKEKLSKDDLDMMRTDLYKKIICYLKEQTGIKRDITPGDSLELDLGIDSLGRVELVSGLEGITAASIGDDVVGRAFTVRDVVIGVEAALSEKTIPSRARKNESWETILRVPPKEENLKKIDLNPGAGAWIAGFFFVGLFKTFFKIFCPLKIEGPENLPKKGPYILYANHVSYFDAFLVAAAMPDFPRLDLFFVGFRAYFDVPVIRRLIKVGRIIPLDFSAHLLEALRSCYYVLENGKMLCLFPEGLRSFDGRLGEFKKGFGILAKETGAKLVPVVLEGAYEAWPRTAAFPRRHPVTVKFGKSVPVAQAEEEGTRLGAKDGYEAVCAGARGILLNLSQPGKNQPG
ncbi:MAG: AMP-binding protein [Candidatus Omnitrophota bacterium]